MKKYGNCEEVEVQQLQDKRIFDGDHDEKREKKTDLVI